MTREELQDTVASHFEKDLDLNFENILEDFFRLPKDDHLEEINKRKIKLNK